ncbi:crotonase/enoyl-CoA hydratase family protein [Phenylobacterium sp.]|jgi:enoyl-CoA hydratase/carnithine racemase|uniref:crotonase/enoyl-CoA hydratase family protein n=1 Tax=Phenylobacterium sp. TaxID=1871053 RepID=UPI0037C676B2
MSSSTPTFETILYAVEDHIATITLHRPERMNAWTLQMCNDLQAAFDLTDRDDDVRAVIVTGAGRAFCAGADLSGGSQTFGAAKPDKDTPIRRDTAGLVTLRIFDSLKPVIGAINGAAVGVGVTMILPMDVRIASTDARFGLVFNRRGIIMEGASSFFLPRLVGMPATLDWIYSGRVFPASEALEKGLVSALHPPESLMEAARALAHEYADNTAPVSSALTRQLCWRMLGASHPMEAHRAESRALMSRGGSDDAVEGVKSFFEKRPANFTDPVSSLPDVFPDWVDPQF